MKKIFIIGGLVILFLIGAAWWSSSLQENDPNIISKRGIHWHPELTIYVKGEKQEIPENIGIGAVHEPIHTHDDSDQGIIHMEFQGSVRKQDATLGRFFKNWGKDFNSFGNLTKMTVNRKENSEYENYVMHDKDKIELYFD
jgi:hypothetical protein